MSAMADDPSSALCKAFHKAEVLSLRPSFEMSAPPHSAAIAQRRARARGVARVRTPDFHRIITGYYPNSYPSAVPLASPFA